MRTFRDLRSTTMILSTLCVGLAPQMFSTVREAVDPAVYRSPAGSFELFVDPTSVDGAGPASATLSRGGVVVWTSDMQVTLHAAAVSDAGTVLGTALEGGGRYGDAWHLLVLGPDGQVLRDDARPYTPWSCISFEEPSVRGGFVLPRAGLFLLRFTSALEGEEWLAIDAETGADVARWRPAERLGPRDGREWDIREARVLGVSELVLVAGFERSRSVWAQRDARPFVALLEPTGDVVWSAVDADVGTRRGDAADEVLSRSLYERLQLTREVEGGFEAWSPSERVLRRYAVLASDANRPRARVELRSSADTPDAPFGSRGYTRAWSGASATEHARPEPERIVLEHLGATPLERAAESAAPELGPIRAWSFDDAGNLLVIREPERRSFELLRVGADAAPGSVTKLAALPDDAVGRIAWLHLGGERWLVTASPPGDGARARAFFADGSTGALTEIARFRCPRVEAGAPGPDGGFVLLAIDSWEYGFTRSVLAFDATGKCRWKITERSIGTAGVADLVGPEDVAVLADGTVCVLDVSRKALLLYDATGAFLRGVDLEAAWGREPNYPTGITTAPDGGLLVHDSGGAPPLNVVGPDGTPRATLTPARADGHTDSGLARAARFAPDGELWTSDGHRLYRLDAAGREIAAVGPAPSLERLHERGSAAIDRLGRICVQDRRTGALHVWESTGRKLLVAAPEPTDFEHTEHSARIVAGPDRGFVVELDGDAVRFDADGRRLGLLGTAENVDYLPGTPRSWSWRRGAVTVRDGADVAFELRRLPSSRWITSPVDVAAFDDGSFALLSDREVGLYSASGESRESFLLPDAEATVFGSAVGPSFLSRIDATERGILLAGSGGTAWWIERADGVPRLVELVGDEGPWLVALGLSPDGGEVWAVDGDALVMHRYALP